MKLYFIIYKLLQSTWGEYMRKAIISTIFLILFIVGCSNGDKEEIKSVNAEEVNSVNAEEINSANVESLNQEKELASEETDAIENDSLWSAIEMLAHYNVSYDDDFCNVDDEFWNKFNAAIFKNSFFCPFNEDSSYDELEITREWSKADLSEAVYSITGHREVFDDYFDEGLDRTDMASPYLHDSYICNKDITKIDDDKYDIQCDMFYIPTAMYAIEGMRRIHVVLIKNEDSPFKGNGMPYGFSIYNIDSEIIVDPTPEVIAVEDFKGPIEGEKYSLQLKDKNQYVWDYDGGIVFQKIGIENGETYTVYKLGMDYKLEKKMKIMSQEGQDSTCYTVTFYDDEERTITITEGEYNCYKDIFESKDKINAS